MKFRKYKTFFSPIPSKQLKIFSQGCTFLSLESYFIFMASKLPLHSFLSEKDFHVYGDHCLEPEPE
jgi:hypothetical protein